MEYAYSSAGPRLAGFTAALLAAVLLLGLMALAQRVLFALAAYHDAQAQENPDAAVWGIVVGLFGLIPGIIYLCVRNSGRRLVRCAHCGYPHDASDYCCPKCGEKNPTAAPEDPFAMELRGRAKKELIAGAVVLAAVIGLSVLSVLFLGLAAIRVGRVY